MTLEEDIQAAREAASSCRREWFQAVVAGDQHAAAYWLRETTRWVSHAGELRLQMMGQGHPAPA